MTAAEPLIYAGIDEAGYGPMLGPLCVGASAFIVHDHDTNAGPPDLWSRLEEVVCRKPSDKRRRVAIADSKRLKGARDGKAHPLRHLERGVLALLGAPQELESDTDLFARLGATIPEHPWYAEPTPLPLAHDVQSLRIEAARLHRTAEAAGVEPAFIAVEVVDADRFNAGVDRAGNKAAVNLEAIVRLAERIRRRWPAAHPRIVIDRQGGRARYADELHLAWPEARVTTVTESPEFSRYRLDLAEGPVTISFLKESEEHHLPVALASMAAKLSRELLMLRFNRFFTARSPDLRPTAGYVQDGRRWLEEATPIIETLGIERRVLVRRV